MRLSMTIAIAVAVATSLFVIPAEPAEAFDHDNDYACAQQPAPGTTAEACLEQQNYDDDVCENEGMNGAEATVSSEPAKAEDNGVTTVTAENAAEAQAERDCYQIFGNTYKNDEVAADNDLCVGANSQDEADDLDRYSEACFGAGAQWYYSESSFGTYCQYYGSASADVGPTYSFTSASHPCIEQQERPPNPGWGTLLPESPLP